MPDVMTAIVIDLDAYRAAARPALTHVCRWSEAAESIAASNVRLLCAWQRLSLRIVWGL